MPRSRRRLAALVPLVLASGALSSVSSADPALGRETESLALLREAEHDADLAPAPATVSDAAARAGTALPSGLDRDFAARLQMPAIAPRITPRLARGLALYRTDPRARRALVAWLRRAERYRGRIEAILASERVPLDLLWVVAAESNFNPVDVSSVGAAGLWQLMPETARSYGLRVDAWVDERRDPDRATRAAARYLRDLHARLGAWELAFAAYNMGYNALLRAVRKYNTNDFEQLAAAEAGLPYETVHYVPRIMTAAVAAHNASLFELGRVAYEPVVAWEDVEVPRSVPLDALAHGAGVALESLRALNPALLRSRTPPADEQHPFALHVPREARARVETALRATVAPPSRLVRVRHGESLDEIAARYGSSTAEVLALSGLARDVRTAAGTELLVPDRAPVVPAQRERPLVAVDPPAETPAGRRVFYRTGPGDDLASVTRALGLRREDLLAWNALDARARLQPGMWLQVYLAQDPPDARVWAEAEVDTLRRGSDDFHDRAVSRDGKVRVRVIVREGDTMESIAAHYALSPGSLARINRRSRRAVLRPGELVVVYAEPERLEGGETLAVEHVVAPSP